MYKNRLFIFKLQIIWCSACIIIGGCRFSTEKTELNELNNNEAKYYTGKGAGPVMNLSIEADIDENMATEGMLLFNSKCTSCHSISFEKRIGPGMKGVISRRTPEWIMNMILNPLEMTKKDSLSKELLLMYQVQMIPMGLNENEARKILEYFRHIQ